MFRFFNYSDKIVTNIFVEPYSKDYASEMDALTDAFRPVKINGFAMIIFERKPKFKNFRIVFEDGQYLIFQNWNIKDIFTIKLIKINPQEYGIIGET